MPTGTDMRGGMFSGRLTLADYTIHAACLVFRYILLLLIPSTTSWNHSHLRPRNRSQVALRATRSSGEISGGENVACQRPSALRDASTSWALPAQCGVEVELVSSRPRGLDGLRPLRESAISRAPTSVSAPRRVSRDARWMQRTRQWSPI